MDFQASDQRWMQLALALAQEAYQDEEIPVGAVIIDSRGTLLAKAYNQTQRLNDVTAHAEMIAITAAANAMGAKYLTGCTLYVTLEPCPMCASALGWSQIERIVFAAPDAKRGYTCYHPSLLHPKTIVQSGLMQSDATALLLEFFAKRRK